jgi:hypothetical protein
MIITYLHIILLVSKSLRLQKTIRGGLIVPVIMKTLETKYLVSLMMKTKTMMPMRLAFSAITRLSEAFNNKLTFKMSSSLSSVTQTLNICRIY